MKYIRLLVFAIFVMPCALHAATNDFTIAAQLLSAAKNADIQQVQILVNNGANINYIDSTGLSIVCTALMNNDIRAAQILQMYGADASNCDRQIKQYNNRTKPKASGGLFGGLSSAQSIALAAAGAAVVVGGLFLLTDVFDPSNDNDNPPTGGDRPGGDGGGGTPINPVTPTFTIPYGPAMVDATAEKENYIKNLDLYSASPYLDSFKVMNALGQNSENLGGQNYMLLMHGYSPWARGYLGMRTLRYANGSPVPNTVLGPINIKGIEVGGGRPTGVALVTENGVNAAPKPKGDGTVTAQTGSLDDRLLAWTTITGGIPETHPEITNFSSKYYNNLIVLGNTDETKLVDAYTTEDGSILDEMDLSGSGTAVNNLYASGRDNLLAQIVGGAQSGFPGGDFLGFMPNGQMSIYRTGGGVGMVEAAEKTQIGTYETTDGVLSKITLTDGTVLTVTKTGTKIVAKNDTVEYNGYIGADGLLYIDNNGDKKIDVAYKLENGDMTIAKETGVIDYKNYEAMLNASEHAKASSDLSGGRSRVDVIANTNVIAPLHLDTAHTIDDILSAGSNATARSEAFYKYINDIYDLNKNDSSTPGADALTFFQGLGASYSPLVLFSTGAFETGPNYSGKTLTATFENAAPLIFGNNMSHLFMSIVAVGAHGAGTSGASDVSGYSPSGKIGLSQWAIGDTEYRARACGVAGKGANGVDPWCFAAAGLTDELATAAAAGAAGVLKSAFSGMSGMMTNQQLFTLMALTADGAYLGTSTSGTPLTKETLTAHLQSMYELPSEYQFRVDNGEDYLEVFKEVFGYGLINLERATKPTSKIYFYDPAANKIVSGNGNAYWRSASNTLFRASSALRPRAASISAPFYDILESIDGELKLPRVWQNEFAIGATDKHGLYMGDVLGEFKTHNVDAPRVQIGNIGFSIAASEKSYSDNLGGLDNIKLDYATDNWDMAASYQRYLTDGASRFDGMHNPIWAMASNAVTFDTNFKSGQWRFGGRAFSGAITDDGLLENDPTISSQYTPARLGGIYGAETHIGWHGEKFGFNASVGAARETETLLGAQTGGLLDMGAGDTLYVDTELRYAPRENLTFTARSTFARTTADAAGQNILGLSHMDSNSFAFAVDAGNFSLTMSRPLTVTRGAMKYAYSDYDVVETDDGKYDLVVRDAYVANVLLSPEHRELRFSAAYRHNFGQFTDGAVGFIYRVNPNNTDEFGNESIFMLKMSHRLGI